MRNLFKHFVIGEPCLQQKGTGTLTYVDKYGRLDSQKKGEFTKNGEDLFKMGGGSHPSANNDSLGRAIFFS